MEVRIEVGEIAECLYGYHRAGCDVIPPHGGLEDILLLRIALDERDARGFRRLRLLGVGVDANDGLSQSTGASRFAIGQK